MRKLRLLDLFSGIGGFSLGLERSGGFETVAFCEIDPFCRKVLAKHWPAVPQYDDVCTLTKDRLDADGIGIDAICGGFPCQDISIAGKGAGLAGERSGLFREVARLIGELRPEVVFLENVSELLARGFGDVLGTLAALGYDAEWRCISGAEIGAPQTRDRVWLVAYPDQARMPGLVESLDPRAHGQRWAGRQADLLSVDPFGRHDLWPQPLIRGVDGRVPNRMDRIGACGNSVFPQIPELLGRAWMNAVQRKTGAAA